MIKKILLLSNTIKNLKASQVFGQIVRRLVGPSYIVEKRGTLSVEFVYFKSSHRQKGKYKGGNLFCFLNQEHRFYTINWDFLEYGKLWNYNLEYFDYLLQDDINNEEKLGLLYSFYEYCIENRRILEPYPVSLRVINIIKFFSIHKIFEDKILNYVTQELFFLSKNLEYHILGNHLLENAFALYLGGVFFNNREWQDKAQNILIKELGEQILEDGAHFELSPMYHNIVFFRVLELIDWYSNYKGRDEEFLCLCNDTASKMRSWIENIQFTNGDIPLFNDAAKGITYDTFVLIEYANTLGIKSRNISLGQSGYRSFVNSNYEIKMDLAQIGASYQPGHAHADALSFVLYRDGEPLFVEQGTSTYQIGTRRNLERSTEAHNTVVVEGKNQSEVWGGFRVGKRAKTIIHNEMDNVYIASHDGYKDLGITHTRSFIFEDTSIQIKDTLNKNSDAKGYVHLHPDRQLIKIDDSRFIIDDLVTLVFEGAQAVVLEDYEYAESYNKYQKAKRFVVTFRKEISTKILFKSS